MIVSDPLDRTDNIKHLDNAVFELSKTNKDILSSFNLFRGIKGNAAPREIAVSMRETIVGHRPVGVISPSAADLSAIPSQSGT